MKKIFVFMLLLMPFMGLVAQNYIIMGSSAAYTQIGEDPKYFYDPGGTAAHQGDNAHPQGYFATGIRDTMKLKTNVNGTQLYINFDLFSMGVYDTLFIFDGEDVNATLIGTYNSVNDPGEILATGRSLTFVFHSDDVNDYAELSEGWIARVYAYITNPQNCLMSIGMSYLTCNAKFYDEGGPNGNMQSSSGTTWCEFTSPVGSHIQMNFTQFSVNGLMKIYDGQYYDNNKRLIGQFCTSTLNASTQNRPPMIISSGSTISIEYVAASGDQNKAGWAADVTCISELFEAPEGSACPSIDITAADTSVSYIEFDCDQPVSILKANVVATGPYSYDYTVTSIPYASQIFPYSIGNSLGASVDDDWINMSGTGLPFHFAFFGNIYDRVWPGANGLISMTQPSSSYCQYSYSAPPASPPYSAVPYHYANCIYGVYEDIYPGHYLSGGDIRVGVQGTAPCRAFVFNYDRVGLYGKYSQGNQWYNTYQMVIYEGTNIIDVYVKYRRCCASTNSTNHEGIIGLQNTTSSQILIPNGRGMTGWEVLETPASPSEAWRFTPITPLDPDGTITWYKNSIHPDSIVGRNFRQVVSPTVTTQYIAVYHYTNAGGDVFDLKDTVVVHVSIPPVVATNNATGNICPNDAVLLNVTADNSFYGITPERYLWSTGDTTQTCSVAPEVTSTYQVTVTFNNGCRNYSSTTVNVTELAFPEITATKDTICIGTSSTLTATHPDNQGMQWSTSETSPTITVSPTTTTDYVVSATMEGGCVTTDTFTVTVVPLPVPAFLATPTDIYVENGVGTVYCTSLSPSNYHIIWNFGDISSMDNVVENIPDPTHDYTRPGYYAITLTAIDSNGCIDSVKSRVQVTVPYFFYVPNSFSPNGDGVNETWAPQGQGVDPDKYRMLIYDRHGNVLFQTTNPYDYWDGRSKTGQRMPADVYVYYITFTTLNGDPKEYNGTITLIK
ncbi:MAG: gliding motility-associated C-terminal domain-containing protein [Bacteroidales bacterium]|nr:gliding motility-associated C-terminal domain-containing protein [Bacteroidales bacterium]